MIINKKTEPDRYPLFEEFSNAQEYCYSCGNELDDWLQAEAEIEALIKAALQ